MYAKVFGQILDSSIADDWELRHFFIDLLILADINGVVDMTPTAIASRTRIAPERAVALLAKLEQPDHESRTADYEGRRIIKLDENRSWGWFIVNYERFRKIASEEQRREKTRERVARFAAKTKAANASLTHPNASLTHPNATNAMQKQRQKQMQKEESFADKPRKCFVVPSRESINLAFAKAGAPEIEAEKFWNHYSANGWKVGKNRMKSFVHAVGGWVARWRERQFQNGNGVPTAKRVYPAHIKNYGDAAIAFAQGLLDEEPQRSDFK